jgi:predicted permease
MDEREEEGSDSNLLPLVVALIVAILIAIRFLPRERPADQPLDMGKPAPQAPAQPEAP